jgi:hypothetical protein
MNLTQFITDLNIPSFVAGLVIPIVAMITYGLLKKIFKRKPKYDFSKVRSRIDEGYQGLLVASKTFHELADLFTDVEETYNK